jgi:hypothetical protein
MATTDFQAGKGKMALKATMLSSGAVRQVSAVARMVFTEAMMVSSAALAEQT